jgi:phosphatidylinositol glycan class W
MGGLQDFIETAPRHCPWSEDNHFTTSICYVFVANREGILGCLGYLSLYFLGEWIGGEYLWRTASSDDNQGGLFRVSIGLWIVLAFLHLGLGIPISRRSTNAAFCIWAAAHNVTLLAILQWSIPPSPSSSQSTENIPRIWDTVNRYGLLMFLIANLLTGLVNLTIPTLEMTDQVALGIVFVYICTVGLAALVVDALWTQVRAAKEKKK